MRVQQHVNYLYVAHITACLVLVCIKFLLTILLYHILHVYYVYGVPYMQVAVIEQMFSYNIQHYAVKALIVSVLRCTVSVLSLSLSLINSVWVYLKG